MKVATLLLALALVLAPRPASAQTASPAAQALSACAVRSMSEEDNITLTTWLFMAIARHPSVSNLVSITDAQRLENTRKMGALINEILVESCAAETRAAFREGGMEAVYSSFGALGEHAMGALMQNPDVEAAVIQVGAYVDEQRLNALLQRAR